LPGASEPIVASEETRKRLLTTELAVSRELIEIVRCQLVQTSETEERDPESAAALALTMIGRMRATLQILEQLDAGVAVPPWLRQDRLCLQVLVEARAVEEARSRSREAELRAPPVPPFRLVEVRCRLLRATTSLLARQLELAEACGADSAEHSKMSRQLLEVERRAKALNDKIETCIKKRQLDQIKGLSVESQHLVEETQRRVEAAWDLCSDHLPAQRDATAILSHVDAIRSHGDGLLKSVDARIAEILPRDSRGVKLRSLQIRKLALLRELLLGIEGRATLGVGGAYVEYSQVLDDNLDAELVLCTTTGERIARCQQHVSGLKGALRRAEAEYRAGRLPRYDLDRMRIRLVDAEISLLREQSRDK